MITLQQRTAGGPAGQQVYATLRSEIVANMLEPGQRLSENELAARFGVSRTPVREALGRLRDDQLVEIVPQLGTFVSLVNRTAVGDAQFVREALECAAIRHSAELASDGDVRVLREIVRLQELTQVDQNFDRFDSLDDELHRALCELGGHELAWKLSHKAGCHLNRVRRMILPLPTYLADMIDQHVAIVDAIAAHNADGAEAALRDHLRSVIENVAEVERAHPEYFASRS
jgi:DNA-binding GntR family transcriptional regulator